ncbi:hypothetical protein DENSPDRAFT_842618 [Dentipellis sp. KUC8613]|nr:hypothetical protein DENSPDRAFT_842618 [Dentipellis sp. KUC8613]
MEDEIIEVPYLSFLRDYAPWNPSNEDVEACLTKLSTEKLISKDRFVDFPGKPSGTVKTEGAAYSSLSNICLAIGKVRVLQQGRTASCTLEQKPQHKAVLEIPGSSHKADGFFRPLDSTVPKEAGFVAEDTPNADIIANCEWELGCTSVHILDNRRKAVSGAMDVMNNDARRLFTYSITIADEQMTLWYWSRSHSAKSEPFDFSKDISATVRALASFIFASMEELGYDSSVQRRWDCSGAEPRLCLVFRVGQRFFKTLRSVSERPTVCIMGRSTRVFEVIEVPSFDDLMPVLGGKTKILKDVWLDVGAKTEKQIQGSIFGELDRISKSDNILSCPQFTNVPKKDADLLLTALCDKNYRHSFLTIVCDEQGTQSKVLSPDAKAISGLFAPTEVRLTSASLRHRGTSRMMASGQHSGSQQEYRKDTAPCRYRDSVSKFRYRVVYEEVCEAVNNVANLATVIKAMEDCLLALQLMFLVGWVHRDISSGNLLWFEAGGRGILSDLEYAKKFNPESQGSSDPKTVCPSLFTTACSSRQYVIQGTPYFIAIEIQRQRYFSSYRQPSRAPRTWANIDDPSKVPAPRPLIIHNFEHDLESFFWLLLWSITTRLRNDEIDTLVNPIFQHNLNCSPQREEAFITENCIQQPLTNLLPDAMKKLPILIEILRDNLYCAYLERSEIGKLESYSGLYGIVREALHRCFLTVNTSNMSPLAAFPAHHDILSAQADPVNAQLRKRRCPDDHVGDPSHKLQRAMEDA